MKRSFQQYSSCVFVSIKYISYHGLQSKKFEQHWSDIQWRNKGGSDEFLLEIGREQIGKVSMMLELSFE